MMVVNKKHKIKDFDNINIPIRSNYNIHFIRILDLKITKMKKKMKHKMYQKYLLCKYLTYFD